MEDGKLVKDKKENLKSDSKLRDYERIPLGVDVDEYFQREVKPHLPNSWMDREKDTVGYEINFTKYFYQYKPLRSSEEITKDLLELERESEMLLHQIVEE
jgi:type I restriction enzyme M protein